MQNQIASFACTALLGTNKAGILKPNADGYYTLVLGALDIFNSANQFYPNGESAKQLFKESSSLMRRIANGALRGEYGHPRKAPGMTTRDFVSRVMDIYEPNVCCHIRKVWIDYSSVKDANGRPVIAILGEVKPTGPMGAALKESLDNPSENVCFSIRSLTNDQQVGGVVHKHLKTIVTWDYVNEPGLEVAKKWRSPSLESHCGPTAMDVEDEVPVMPAHLASLRNAQRQGLVAMESSGGVSVDEITEALGWDLSLEGLEPQSLKRPPSAKW